MKDAAHHLKHVRKKVIQSIRREQNGVKNPMGDASQIQTSNGNPANDKKM